MKRLVVCTATLLLGTSLTAATFGVASEREAHAHEHGTSSLNIAIEDTALLLELESPAADLVGFEHAPKNDADHEAIKTALETLKTPDKLFVPDASANCTLSSAKAKTFGAISEEDSHDHEDDHSHGEDEHGHAEDEHGHAEDEHGHSDDGHSDEEHSEFYAIWVWECGAMDELKKIGLPFFKVFPTASQIRVQIISENGQLSRTVQREDESVSVLP